MKAKKFLLLLLCVPLLVTGCKKVPKLENGQEVIVELNGKSFTAEEFYEELKKVDGANVLIDLVDSYIASMEMTDSIASEALNNATAQINYLKAYYGTSWESALTSNGYNNENELLEAFTDSYEKELVVEKYIKYNVISDEEVNSYYDENIYGEITARHILIIPDVTDDMSDDEKAKAKEDALNEAKELIKQLDESEDLENDFITLAKEKSDDTGTASEGGLIENFTNESGLVTEFWEASLALEVGKYSSSPVESEYGYHIIYKVSQNEKPSVETVKETILTKLAKEILNSDNSYNVYMAGLREKYNLVIHDDTIKDAYDSTMKRLQNN